MNDLMRIKTFIIGKDRKQILFNKEGSGENIKLHSCIVPGLDQIKKDTWFSTLRNYRLKIKMGVENGQEEINIIGLETLLTPRQSHPIFPINQIFLLNAVVELPYNSIEFIIETADGKTPELNFEFTHTKTEGLVEQVNHFAVGMGLLSSQDIV